MDKDKSIEYVRLKMELNYFSRNRNLLVQTNKCMYKEGLPCNCITGIMMNYAGYIVKNCFKKDYYEATYELENNVRYIRVLINGLDLCPIFSTSEGMEKPFYFCDDVCMLKQRKNGNSIQTERRDEPVYIPFRKYNGLEEISSRCNDLKLFGLKGQDIYRFELLIRFLSALRMKSMMNNGVTFLAMAIFMFPNKTLNLINKAIQADNVPIEQTIEFYKNYLSFLREINDTGLGYKLRLSLAFEKLTGVNIAGILEFAETEDVGDLVGEMLEAAFQNNINEITIHRGGFCKFIAMASRIQNEKYRTMVEEMKLEAEYWKNRNFYNIG